MDNLRADVELHAGSAECIQWKLEINPKAKHTDVDLDPYLPCSGMQFRLLRSSAKVYDLTGSLVGFLQV
jgi:hypothetical protein